MTFTMVRSLMLSAISAMLFANQALAACETTRSFTSCADNIVHWYDPSTGEVCDPLDCGGGRAPPKTVPGCPAYSGPLTYHSMVSTLSCWTPSFTTTASTASVSSTGPSTVIISAVPTSTNPISTATSGVSSTTGIIVSSSSITSSTTPPATLSTPQTSSTTSIKRSTSASTTPVQQTANAAHFVRGSMMGIAGAVMGAVALL